MRTRRAIDITSETARRARKLLFATALWEHDQTNDAAGRQGRRLDGHQLLRRRLGPKASPPRTARSATSGCGPSTSNTPPAFVDEVADLLRQMPRKGLIIDLRSNPGGVIDAAERLFQLFTTNRIEPARFACRATPAMVRDGRSRRQRCRGRGRGAWRAPSRRGRPRRRRLPRSRTMAGVARQGKAGRLRSRLRVEELEEPFCGVDDAAGVRVQVDDETLAGHPPEEVGDLRRRKPLMLLDVEGPQPEVSERAV